MSRDEVVADFKAQAKSLREQAKAADAECQQAAEEQSAAATKVGELDELKADLDAVSSQEASNRFNQLYQEAQQQAAEAKVRTDTARERCDALSAQAAQFERAADALKVKAKK